MPALDLERAAVEALAQQRQLVAALRSVIDDLQCYRITRATAASRLQETLILRHRDQQGQCPPPTLNDPDGYGYGAMLERIAFDFAGSAPLGRHIHALAQIVDELKAGLSDFHRTHRLYPSTKKHHDH